MRLILFRFLSLLIFLNYTINLAILMKEMDILEIDENLFFSKRVDAVKFSSLKITSEQRLLLKKFFSKKYDPILFKNNDEFKQYKYGYQGCLFLHTYGMPDNISYAFSHKEFLNYFFNFNVLRRKKIQKFINSLETKSDVILPLCQTSVQSRHSFKHSRHTSIFDQEGVHPFSYSRSTSRRESLYSQSRRSSVMSKEEGISIRKVSGQEPKVSFFTDISRTDIPGPRSRPVRFIICAPVQFVNEPLLKLLIRWPVLIYIHRTCKNRYFVIFNPIEYVCPLLQEYYN